MRCQNPERPPQPLPDSIRMQVLGARMKWAGKCNRERLLPEERLPCRLCHQTAQGGSFQG